MDGLCVPDLAILEAVLLFVDSGQKSKLSPDAKVRHNDIECFVEELVFGDLVHEVLSSCLALIDRLRSILIPEQGYLALLLVIRALDHLGDGLGISQIIEAHCLQVHNIANIKTEDPVVRVEVLDSKGTPSSDLEPLLILELVHLFDRLE